MHLFKAILIPMIAALLLLAAGPAKADTVTFNNDVPGPRPNGFISVDSLGVRFSNPNGQPGDMVISNLDPNNGPTNVLVIFDGELRMDFIAPITMLSLQVGNDDPCCLAPGARAILTVFSGATQVGQTDLLLNLNDRVDQTISFSGLQFDSAVLRYEGVAAEVVDNVTFDLNAPIPEPTAMVLLGTGLALRVRRRRKGRFLKEGDSVRTE